MKLTCTLNIITVLLRILYRRHLNMLCGIIWAVCEIRTYFIFVSNYFLAFHVLVGKVVWLTQSRMVRYIRQASWHLNISHKGRNETTMHLVCDDALTVCTMKCGQVLFSFWSVALQLSAFTYVDELDWVLRTSRAGCFLTTSLIYGKNSHRNLFLLNRFKYMCSNGSTLREFNLVIL
jgi:hypothetical protein